MMSNYEQQQEHNEKIRHEGLGTSFSLLHKTTGKESISNI